MSWNWPRTDTGVRITAKDIKTIIITLKIKYGHGRYNKDPNLASRDEKYNVWDEKCTGLD